MCGICLILEKEKGEVDREAIKKSIQKRGPDDYGSSRITMHEWEGLIGGAVLAMRGDGVTRQPISKNDWTFAWNGEIFAGLDVMNADNQHTNDTTLLFAALQLDLTEKNIINTLRSVSGPFSFILHTPTAIYYGRDPLGRRSLVSLTTQTSFTITSVSPTAQPNGKLFEVPTGGIFKYTKHNEDPVLIPWEQGPLFSPLKMVNNTCVKDPVSVYLDALTKSVQKRVVLADKNPHKKPEETEETNARIGVLYSGGVDCAVLAALASTMVPMSEPIDLLNVAFGDHPRETPDRLAARQGWAELSKAYPGRVWNLIEIDMTADDILNNAEHLTSLVTPANTIMDLNIASALWFASNGTGRLVPVSELSETNAPPSLLRRAASGDEGPAPPIHDDGYSTLINAVKSEVSCGRHYVTLSDLTKTHKLPFKHAGCKKAGEYVTRAAKKRLLEVKGKGTDMAVGLPGAGDREKNNVNREETKTNPVTTGARALLVGMGADETLGGYSRYRTVYNQAGGCVTALAKEMEADFQRLWRRNLGRDDRVISDNGREARFPFLDEELLRTLSTFNMQQVTDLTLPLGIGEKTLLRECAKRLGIPMAGTLQKRAIQFGTRLANSRVDGTTVMPPPGDGLRDALMSCMNTTVLKKRPWSTH
eukprot:TRINITY_DN3507_c0_g3_i1.p1 TRINITY_DN3507_c0_g3~~TRINITY_DN3507_c0_g3_i1.p1  ORF type:complete len:647 (+),score=78.58 TRINITY_DN3507_c0_g3_i1:30-1970(+)